MHWVDMRNQLHVSAALTAMKDLQYPLDRRHGELQNRSGQVGEVLFLPEIKPWLSSPQPGHYAS
jgi:hypothetical protein